MIQSQAFNWLEHQLASIIHPRFRSQTNQMSSHCMEAVNSWRWPLPEPASARVAMTTMSSLKPTPSAVDSSWDPMGIRASSRVTATSSLATFSLKKKLLSTNFYKQKPTANPTIHCQRWSDYQRIKKPQIFTTAKTILKPQNSNWYLVSYTDYTYSRYH